MYIDKLLVVLCLCISIQVVISDDNFYAHSVTDINGQVIDLSKYAGQVSSLSHVSMPLDFFQILSCDCLNVLGFCNLSIFTFHLQVSLVVNVASACGYTDGHYRALTKLQDQLAMTKKFNVLAFPCNQFGAQEPGVSLHSHAQPKQFPIS